MNNITKGYKLVPEVATLEMKNAGWRECDRQGIEPESIEMQTIWTAMHLAAPAPPQPIYDEAKERELFESFVVGFHHGAKLTGYVHDDPDYPGLNGQFLYEDWDVQSAWAVWQKCAQSRAKAGEDE